MLKKEDFQAYMQSKLDEYKNTISDLKELEKKGELDFNSGKLNYNFLQRHELTLELENYSDLDSLIQNLVDFRESLEPLRKNAKFSTEISIESDFDDSYVEAKVIASSYTVKEYNKDLAEAWAKKETKAWLINQIKEFSKSSRIYFSLDCKLVSLWLEDKIDFETLVSITTSNCKV
jgi:hypothetical protein